MTDWLNKLLPEFYSQLTLDVARAVLGKVLVCGEASGLIVETEGYIGPLDPACHAYTGRTRRNDVMWGPPGCAYVYFTYGNHWMLNIVTERADYPAAVLIRALQPISGLDSMRERRELHLLKSKPIDRNLTNGPGKLCKALGITGNFNGISLQSDQLFIAEPSPQLTLPYFEIVESTRIGITRGKEFPWRFYVKGNRFVSKF